MSRQSQHQSQKLCHGKPRLCCDKARRQTLSRQSLLCCNKAKDKPKKNFVATKFFFVATEFFCRNKVSLSQQSFFVLTKFFFVTKIFSCCNRVSLSKQSFYVTIKFSLCRDIDAKKTRKAQKLIFWTIFKPISP